MQQASSQITGDLVRKLYADDSLDTRFNHYDTLVRELGFDAVCYSFIPRSSLQESIKQPPIFKASKQFSDGFMTRYETDDFYNQDFTIREIKEGNLSPKDWKTHEQSGKLSDQETNVIKVAREQYGIENAFSIPTMNHQSGIAGASLISSKNDQDYQKMLNQHQQTLVNCTRIFNDIIIQHASADIVHTFVFSTLPNITPTERIVLRDLVNGLALKQIGEAEGISENSVSNHLSRLRDKFEVNKTADLKHLMITLNILDYL